MNTVNSPEELDALPSGSVIRSATGVLFEKKDDLWYVSSANMNQAKENGKFPSVILHNPESSALSPHDTTIANQARRIDMLETGHRHWRGQCRILKLKIAEYERGISRRYGVLREEEKKWDELQDYLSKASNGSIPSTDSQYNTHRAVGLHNVRDIVEQVINGSPDNPRLAVDPDADMFESEVRKLIHSRIGANNVSSEQCKAIASAMRTAGFVRLRQ